MFKTLKPYYNEEVREFPNNAAGIKPLVSIIVITYNHKNYIEQCLKSLLEQKTNFDFEILLGDDDSQDGTRDICKTYAKQYPEKIRLFLHSRKNNIKVDGKPTGRFNYLYNLYSSKGTYIAVCEGDDFWTHPEKLQKQVDFLDANKEYSFCWTRFNTLDQGTSELTLDINEKYFQNNEQVIDFDFERSLKGWHIGNLTLVYRKQFFNIDIHQKFKYFRDVHLIAQLLKKGNGACLNFVGATYRKHDSGIHSSISAFKGFEMGYKTHKEIYLDNNRNVFLKKKYLLSFKNYTNAHIQEGKLFKAFVMSIQLFLKNWAILDFLRHLKRIGTKLLQSK